MEPNIVHYSEAINPVKIALMTPIDLGILLESSEYEIQLNFFDGLRMTGTFKNYMALLHDNQLKIITHELKSITYEELIVHSLTTQQKFSFFVVPNLFEMSCENVH